MAKGLKPDCRKQTDEIYIYNNLKTENDYGKEMAL